MFVTPWGELVVIHDGRYRICSEISGIASIINIGPDNVDFMKTDGSIETINNSALLDFFDRDRSPVKYNNKTYNFVGIEIKLNKTPKISKISQLGDLFSINWNVLSSPEIVGALDVNMSLDYDYCAEITLKDGNTLFLENPTPADKYYIGGEMQKIDNSAQWPNAEAVYKCGDIYAVLQSGEMTMKREVISGDYFLHESGLLVSSDYQYFIDIPGAICVDNDNVTTESGQKVKINPNDRLPITLVFNIANINISDITFISIHNNNAFNVSAGFYVYFLNGKYYDNMLNIVKPRHIDFPVPNYNIDNIYMISIHAGVYFINGLFPILSELAQYIENIEFTYKFPWNLEITLVDNKTHKCCINGNEIMFDDGRTFEIMPADETYYGRWGKFNKLQNYINIGTNMFNIDDNIITFRMIDTRIMIGNDDIDIYECCGSYFAKVGRFVLFGEVSIRAANKKTKPAFHNIAHEE